MDHKADKESRLRSDSPAMKDQWIAQIEMKREAGLQVTASDLMVPVECPACHITFTVLEAVYVGWRSGLPETIECELCNEAFRPEDAPWSTLKCDQCGAESGDIPALLCHSLKKDGWSCIECQTKEKTASLLNTIQSGRHEKEYPNSCLSVVIVIALAVLLGLVLGPG